MAERSKALASGPQRNAGRTSCICMKEISVSFKQKGGMLVRKNMGSNPIAIIFIKRNGVNITVHPFLWTCSDVSSRRTN